MSDQHDHAYVKYSSIFYALCICTGLSIVFDVIDLKKQNIIGMNGVVLLAVLVLAVACAKALFVLIYFMHLKFEGRWKYVLLSPTIVLAMGLTIAITPDIGIHYYTNEAPQIDYLEQARETAAKTDALNPEKSHVE
ncbi:cytochrome C oxidase subunit IV family protein [Gimesia sp.]|uniref:cytochrome C oxidase subunit IV family protein n=1 Tax=Gimesia sp. TaxID=2024833 RepID=UPI000C4713E5|nr:cytochrome C oxidase subunit IV family protein [Gimesia sp.]MAX36095.1 oxidase [Gimesia sp.]HBL44291.1 oxidase [Planctomycetaceae bacterium]|tara:strand:+ start:639 stop:1046 length:408 start_codon:yes stop_codon:yes gene_type:complete